ncbi:MAG: hypothetical protein PHD95_05970 [Candidatus ainarchaeum sp.]|nr:hypothetical protein [Candidatus ainarchaeum sp.]
MKGKILMVILIALALLAVGCTTANPPQACTMEAKLCPDGSSVGRVLPNCEFAPCPETGQNQNIKLATDKTAYNIGETVTAELQNNSEQSIFVKVINIAQSVYQKKSDGTYEVLALRDPTIRIMSVLPRTEEIKSGEEKSGTWNGYAYQLILYEDKNRMAEWKPYQPVGTFKIETGYSFAINPMDNNQSSLKEPIIKVESNEFEIANNQIANPASTFCIEEGGSSVDGNCSFETVSCPEWDFFRGKCGQEFTNCSKAGFEVQNAAVTEGESQMEYGLCVISSDKNCLLQDFNGNC